MTAGKHNVDMSVVTDDTVKSLALSQMTRLSLDVIKETTVVSSKNCSVVTELLHFSRQLLGCFTSCCSTSLMSLNLFVFRAIDLACSMRHVPDFSSVSFMLLYRFADKATDLFCLDCSSFHHFTSKVL